MTGHRQLVVGVVGTAGAWRSEFWSHVREHIEYITVRVAYEPGHLLEAPLNAVIVDDVTSWVTRPLLDRLASVGTVVVGVYDPDESEGQGARYLERLGVAHTVASTCAPAELAARLLDILDRPLTVAPPRGGAFARDNGADDLRGAITVVGGPGGTGATEVALCLADRLAARGQRVVLVDLDDRSPSLAMRLDTYPSPHILGALDAAGRGDDILDHVARYRDDRPKPPFHTIVGAGTHDEWLRIRSDDVTELLDQLRRWDHAIVNVGSEIDAGAGLGPSRYTGSTVALRRADRVIGVCDGSAFHQIGRYLSWFAAVAPLIPATNRILTAVNRLPARKPERRLSAEEGLSEHLPAERRAGFVWLPFDNHLSEASWKSEHIRRGRFHREVDGIAELLSPTAPAHSRRRPQRQRPTATEATGAAS